MATATLEQAPFTNAQHHLAVPVAWDQADSIRKRLRERGILAVACFDPEGRKASIELPQGVDLGGIQDILNGNPT